MLTEAQVLNFARRIRAEFDNRHANPDLGVNVLDGWFPKNLDEILQEVQNSNTIAIEINNDRPVQFNDYDGPLPIREDALRDSCILVSLAAINALNSVHYDMDTQEVVAIGADGESRRSLPEAGYEYDAYARAGIQVVNVDGERCMRVPVKTGRAGGYEDDYDDDFYEDDYYDEY